MEAMTLEERRGELMFVGKKPAGVAVLAVALFAFQAAPARAQRGNCVDRIWYEAPTFRNPSVHNQGDDNPLCVQAALDQARDAINQSGLANALRDTVATMVKLAGKVAKAFGIPIDKGLEIASIGLKAESEEDFANRIGEWASGQAGGEIAKKLGGDELGRIGKAAAKRLFKLLFPNGKSPAPPYTYRAGNCEIVVSLTIEPGVGGPHGTYRLDVSGDCHCAYLKRHAVRMADFHVWADGVFEITEAGCRLERNDWYVLANCRCPADGGGAPTPTPPEEPPPPPPTPTPTDDERRRATDSRIARDRCRLEETDYQNAQIEYENAMLEASSGRKGAAAEVNRRLKIRDDARRRFCDCARRWFGAAGLPLPGDIDRICNPRRVVPTPTPPHTTPVIPGGPTPGVPGPPADPCETARQTYETHRERYLGPGVKDAAAMRDLARAKRDYCDCLKRRFGRRLPDDVKRFCDAQGAPEPPGSAITTGGPGIPPPAPPTAAPTEPPRVTPPPTPTQRPSAPTAVPAPTPPPRTAPPPTAGPSDSAKCALCNCGQTVAVCKAKHCACRHD
jgi:hypothetical protein